MFLRPQDLLICNTGTASSCVAEPLVIAALLARGKDWWYFEKLSLLEHRQIQEGRKGSAAKPLLAVLECNSMGWLAWFLPQLDVPREHSELTRWWALLWWSSAYPVSWESPLSPVCPAPSRSTVSLAYRAVRNQMCHTVYKCMWVHYPYPGLDPPLLWSKISDALYVRQYIQMWIARLEDAAKTSLKKQIADDATNQLTCKPKVAGNFYTALNISNIAMVWIGHISDI